MKRPKKAPPKNRRLSVAEEREPVRRLPNPFSSGQAGRMSPEDLVRYTFEALHIWAITRGFPFDANQTPLEFAERLAQREPAMKHEIFRTASYYARLEYGNQRPPEEFVGVLRSLWSVIGFS
jgi:hypothetical protein